VWIDLLLLLAAVSRSTGMSIAEAAGGRLLRAAASLAGLVILLLLAARLIPSQPAGAIALTLVSLLAFCAAAWSLILRGAERSALRGVVVSRLRGSATNGPGSGQL
jgi:hypothetical protein